MTFPVAGVSTGLPVSETWGDAVAAGINYLQNIIEGPLTAWTPVWTAATTNPAIGNGSIVGGYKQFGDLVYVQVTITMGSTTTYGSGGYRVNAPITPSGKHLLNGVLRASASLRVNAEWETSTGLFLLRTEPATPTSAMAVLQQGTPVTLASTHVIAFSGWYNT